MSINDSVSFAARVTDGFAEIWYAIFARYILHSTS
jgi:hypothetical protein